MPTDRPVVFLGFADARSDLSSLKVEGWSLKDQFDELKRRGVIADVVVEEKASLERIYSVFQKYRDRIALFHFGGHADGDRLLLQSAFEPRPAYAEGLATLLGQQRGLKLVFLNGCSTRPQVKRLLDAGAPAVIATARPIDDAVATEFAVAFYQALTTGYSGENRKITGGCSLAMAFAQAEGLSKAARGGKSRDFVAATPSHEEVTDDDGFPWIVQYRKGSEHLARWNLFEDDPLFGLPGLPADIGWPVEPYRNLEYFQRDHARIFFGRGRAIRELYDLLTLPAGSAESRLIFYYGQTGVGKTSVLAAGLLPRVEALFATRYCRRSAQDGLLGTLRAELAPGAEPFDLGMAWLEIEREARCPLLIVLDQAEEAFTRPRADSRPKDEVHELFEAVREAFTPTRSERPRGRLILSFRKEWLAEFNEIRKAPNLDIKPKMLDPLDRPGVVEAIEGPADHFGLVISPDRNSVEPGETTLTEFISHGLFDTLANPQTEQESPIAPTLQILLTRMWKEANDPKRLRGRPTFDRALYQELKGKGFKLDEAIQEQFDKIAEVEALREAVEKGLLLDLLEFFTTHEGTADTHTRQQIHDRYPHQPAEQLDALLEACQNRYLLAHVGVGADGTAAYRLTHDTLAPLLRQRFRVSPALAPRARHVLEGRVATWKAQPTDPVLDRVDLASVEEGLPWMRALEKGEPELLESSRQAEKRRVADEEERRKQLRDAEESRQRETVRRLRATLIGLSVSLTLLGVAGWGWRTAWVREEQTNEKARIAESRRLAALSDSERDKRLDRSLLLAMEALGTENSFEARNSLFNALLAQPGLTSFLRTDEGNVTSVAFSPDGKTLAVGYGARRSDGGVVLWDVTARRRLADEPLTVKVIVNSVAFSPDGKTLAVGGGRGVVLFDLTNRQGIRAKPLTVPGGLVGRVAFSPDGRILAALYDAREYRAERGVPSSGVVLFDVTKQERLQAPPLQLTEGNLRSVAFSPDSKTLAAGYNRGNFGGGGVVFFDATNCQRLVDQDLRVTEGSVESVAFSSDRKTLAAGYDFDYRGGVVLFDVTKQERLQAQPLRVTEGGIRSVAFSLDGKTLVAGYSTRDAGGVVLFDVTKQERLQAQPLRVTEGVVTSVAFSPDGKTLAAGYILPDDEGGVVLFDATTGQRLQAQPVPVAEGNVTSMAFSSDRKTLAAGYNTTMGDGGVVLFDATTRQRLQAQPGPVAEGDVTSVAFSPDGKTLAAGYTPRYGGGGVVLFDARSQKWLQAQPLRVTEVNVNSKVTSVAFSPDGKTLAAGFYYPDRVGGVVLFDATNRQRLQAQPLPVAEGSVTSIAFSPDGKTLAAGYSSPNGDGGVVLFDATSQKRLHAQLLPVAEVDTTSVAFSPDGKILAAGYKARSVLTCAVVLFDAKTPQQHQARRLPVTEGGVESVAFSPEGKTLLAVGYIGGVVLFDATTRQRLVAQPFEVPGFVWSVAFSRDGKTLAAGGGGVMLLDVDPISWRRKAAHVANRNFTRVEWTLYFPDTPYRRTIRSLPWPRDLPEAERKQAEAFEKEHPEGSDAS